MGCITMKNGNAVLLLLKGTYAKKLVPYAKWFKGKVTFAIRFIYRFWAYVWVG